MKILTIEEEAEKLKARFEGVNRAAFAREQRLKGGQAMIYQHINAMRPISLDAALVYAKGFNCPLEEISPRLAKEAMDAAQQTGEQGRQSNAELENALRPTPRSAQVTHVQRINESEAELLTMYRLMDDVWRTRLIEAAKKMPMMTLPVGSRHQG